jgi:hypothetical protein
VDSDTVIMGDLNGHVGSVEVPGIVGKFGTGTRNAEGDLLIDFAARNNMAIMNTYFDHSESHKYTWYRFNSIEQRYDQRSQIDFILTNNKAIIKDVRAIPSLSIDSDHRLLKGKLKLHQIPKISHLKRERLQTENVKKKKEELEERIHQELQSITSESLPEMWDDFNRKMLQVEKNIIGMKTIGQGKKKRTAWWTPEVQETVRAKQKAFRKWIMNRTAENREN